MIIDTIPFYVTGVFSLTIVFALYMFYLATLRNKMILIVTLIWLLLQSAISISGFYLYEKGMPPRFAMLVMPPLVTVIVMFATGKGRRLIDTFDLKHLTYLQAFRLPVELVLYWLHLASFIPVLMTFEGRNFDILAGFSAPVIGYLFFNRKSIGRRSLLLWNVICLLLLINIVANAVLSAPTVFQKFAFDMPNTGVLYFPFVWLPGYLVPLALLSHLVSIRQLMRGNTQSSQT